jgi:hypothetical protein
MWMGGGLIDSLVGCFLEFRVVYLGGCFTEELTSFLTMALILTSLDDVYGILDPDL